MGATTTTNWNLPVLGLSPNVWNVIKFLILEIVISVFIRSTYIQFLRSRVQNHITEGRYVSLVSTSYGRLTPYDFMWWSSPDARSGTLKHRTPKLILFLLNIALLALAITAEFGSGSTFTRKKGTLVGFGKRSEMLARNRTIPTPKYVNLKSFVPDPSCIEDGVNGGRVIRALDERGHCSSDVSSNEGTTVFGCASHPGEILTKVCDVDTVKHAVGAKGAPGVGYSDVHLVLNVTDFRRVSTDEVTGVFEDTSGQRAIVEGVFITAIDIIAGERMRRIESLKRTARCYVKFNEAFERDPRKYKWMYLARACHVADEDFEATFVSSRRFEGVYGDILQKYSKGFTSPNDTNAPIKKGDTLVVSPTKGTVVIRQGVKKRKPVHTGIILYVSETRRARRFISDLSSLVRKSLHARLSDDIVARLLGFIEGIGEYEYETLTKGTEPVASVNLFFLIPLGVMFLMSAVQGALSFRSRPGPAIPCTFEEAISKYCMNEPREFHRAENKIPTFRAVMLHEVPRTNSSVDGLMGTFLRDDMVGAPIR